MTQTYCIRLLIYPAGGAITPPLTPYGLRQPRIPYRRRRLLEPRLDQIFPQAGLVERQIDVGNASSCFAVTLPFKQQDVSRNLFEHAIDQARRRWAWFTTSRELDAGRGTEFGSLGYLLGEIRQQIFKVVLGWFTSLSLPDLTAADTNPSPAGAAIVTNVGT
ncbi:hypothetical protein HO173_002949 [Letharia columbiana]|uniref:Uncharacterized protein n=1 Tax=Letharia columbiana TaxID=112416 RepID=A0A8H6G209_9LECA|nr:uncharacterized protein HO173_002949 [Letharia columbiana]KAF6239077.1 hypothetical protein HO173_002949 [Letharia columbiana]